MVRLLLDTTLGQGSNLQVIGSGDITRVYMSQDGDAVMCTMEQSIPLIEELNRI